MRSDGRSIRNGETIQADLCIVGAGAAGITLARELVGSELRVVLLESGGLEPDGPTQELYRGELGGRPYFPLEGCRLRYFGGSTNHWTGWCRPLEPVDFEAREWVPHSGWPITRRDLDPFYERAHPICQLGPNRYEPEYWASREGSTPLPVRREQVSTKTFQLSPPTRFGEVYRKELLAAPNVHTLLHANVVEIELAPESSLVRRTRVATLAGNRFSVEARAFVLACGGIENARLLLASRSSRPRGLGNEHDLVGRFFMDHPHLRAGIFLASRGAAIADFYVQGRPGSAALGALAVAEPQLRRHRLLGFGLTLVEPAEDVELATDAFSRDVATLIRDLDGGGGQPEPTPGGAARRLVSRSEPNPDPTSRVVLSERLDALGVPTVRLEWRLGPDDFRSLRRGLELVAAEVGHAGLGRMRLPPDGEGAPWRALVAGGQHHLGTTRMAADPRRGVVDADGKVHDLANLFVAGGSVFPTAGLANPTLTIVALALRLAERLRETLS